MSRRCVSRYLLSVLMLWQLFASVFAHPLGLSQQATATAQSTMGAEHCHEHALHLPEMNGMDMSGVRVDADHAQAMHGDSCKSACKCPCAGTPALSFVLDFFAPVCHEAVYAAALTDGIASQPPSKRLRPPI